jgi:xanthine dehydrogenase YagT iron-sulfur-binding subunit
MKRDRAGHRGASAAAGLSRRGFMGSVAAIATYAALHEHAAAETGVAPVPAPQPKNTGPRAVRLLVNGRSHDLSIEPRVTLLDALRDYAGLTGTKKGCDRGQCGACTVLVEGRRIKSCLTLAVMHEGAKITTVEGLAGDRDLSPLQAAFVERDAFQCGYCTPGQLCAATALLAELSAGEPSAVSDLRSNEKPAPTDAEIRERMSGNICRCGAYPNIVAAIRDVAISDRS